MALLWEDIAADVGSAKRHFAEAVKLYRSGFGEPPDYVAVMAFQHAMQSGYTSFETGMRRLLSLLNEPLPLGPDSHVAILKRLGRAVEGHRPAVLAPELVAYLDELRAFRHVAMHAYDGFQPRKAAIPFEAAEAFLADIDGAIGRFRSVIDPPAA